VAYTGEISVTQDVLDVESQERIQLGRKGHTRKDVSCRTDVRDILCKNT
jgi:hypothetical protein